MKIADFQGVTVPISELYNQIHIRGWQVTKVDLKNHQYVAEAKNPHGEKIERQGPDPATAVAGLLTFIIRRETIRATHRLAQWGTTFTDKLPLIAQAYAKAPIFDPKAAIAWKALADDSVARARVLQQQLKVEVVHDPEPYTSVQEMAKDVHQRKHFFVSDAHSQHPVWTTDQNVAFRIVHDVLGHCASGGDFGWTGENLACSAHLPLLSAEAQKALFTECIGQTAYAAFYRAFGPQKVAFLDEHIQDAQEAENAPGHSGVHPNFSLAPTQMPTIPQSNPVGMPAGNVAPHMETTFGPTPLYAKRGTVIPHYDEDALAERQQGFLPVIADGDQIHVGNPGAYHQEMMNDMPDYNYNERGHGLLRPHPDGRMYLEWYSVPPENQDQVGQELSQHFNRDISSVSEEGTRKWDF